MVNIYLVRHGEAAGSYAEASDPGLSELGRRQASASALELAPLGPLTILSSPLARARETAIPLVARWGKEPIIETRVAEIPSFSRNLSERGVWLRQAIQGSWSDLEPACRLWRDALVECVCSINESTVIFSHFTCINVLVGHITNDERVMLFSPDNGSITHFQLNQGKLNLINLGHSAYTKVN